MKVALTGNVGTRFKSDPESVNASKSIYHEYLLAQAMSTKKQVETNETFIMSPKI